MVARQYEAYAYPAPLRDLGESIAAGYFEPGDPSRYGPLLWPEGRPRRRLRILAAGCGTVQAAYLAFTNPDCEVIGIDLSEASLAHERYLQDRHGLANLRLFRGDLREAGSIGQEYDYIACTGVLHHLADPEQGLRALAQVLSPGGVMVLMVYGATARTGVYMLQDAFRRLRVPQTDEGVAFARRLVEQLGGHHFVHWYLRGAAELSHPAAFVDTFLHPQDRAYTVPQVLELLERNGLAFQAWVDNGLYYPDATLSRFSPEVQQAVARIPEREQWAVVEMLTLRLGMHVLLACRPERSSSDYSIDFSRADWDLCVPHRMPGFERVPEQESGRPARFRRGSATIEMGEPEAGLLDRVDGSHSIRDLLESPALAPYPAAARADFVRDFFRRMHRLGHLMYSRDCESPQAGSPS